MSAPALVELAAADVCHPASAATVLIEAVDWRIERGEFHVVGGEQESGRSALLATAAGLNRPAAGELRLFGCDVATAREAEQIEWRHRIGFVFEHGGRLLSNLTVLENVALPLQYHLHLDPETACERAEALLAWGGLEAIGKLNPAHLSVRLQQRASLVRALALPKEILFLDNPLAGTTSRGARWWFDLLRQIATERAAAGDALTVVATCDDFTPWLDVASHFALIEKRRLRVLGGREALTASDDASLREFLSEFRWGSKT